MAHPSEIGNADAPKPARPPQPKPDEIKPPTAPGNEPSPPAQQPKPKPKPKG